MFSTPPADDSLARAQATFEDLHTKLKHGHAHSRQMAIGLALQTDPLPTTGLDLPMSSYRAFAL